MRDARDRFVDALNQGDYENEDRDDKEAKNWLATERVSADEVQTMLHRCRGDQYETSPHHFEPELTMHEFKPRYKDKTWYIKGYFIDDRLHVYSVHPSR